MYAHQELIDIVAASPDADDGTVSTPGYVRGALSPGIVHIGVGGFHRAHLAVYIDDLAEQGESWGIVGSGVMAGDSAMADALKAQDGLYTLIVRGHDATSCRVIGSIVDYLHAHPDPTALMERIADDETKIVSLTVTEGGYPIDDVTGNYDPDSPPAGSDGAFGILARALALRHSRGAGPLTVLSCDNIMTNGQAARASTLGEAAEIDPTLAEWVSVNVTFPNSMVDRITPVTSDTDRQWLTDEHGIHDRWPVVTEPFRQWVLEDDFAAGRPSFENFGVILTNDVEPYELMKLRLLNAGHSCLAYISALAGIEFVHDAIAQPLIAEYLKRFLDREAAPTLAPVPGIDIDEYTASLIERFSNPAIADQISRLCLDGSAKFPKFLIPTLRAQLEQDGSVELAALGLAGWSRYLLGVADDGSTFTPSPDPDLARATEFATAAAGDPAAFLGYDTVFDPALAADARFISSFSSAYRSLTSNGVLPTLEHALRPKGSSNVQQSI